MNIGYVSETKRVTRRSGQPYALACGDRMVVAVGREIVRRHAWQPEVSETLLDYYSRKLAAFKAEQFRLRYGRDYWTGKPA